MSVDTALRRLAHQPNLLVLAGGQATHVRWRTNEHRVSGWDDLAALISGNNSGETHDHGAAESDRASTWSIFGDGVWCQLDYEFPRTPGRAWTSTGWATWTNDGRCTLYAHDPADLTQLGNDLAQPEQPVGKPLLISPLTPFWDAHDHQQHITRIQQFIAAGDIYQANLTVPFDGRLAPGQNCDLAIFLALLAQSPASYSALFRTRNCSVISHSPECFLRVRGDNIVSEPIKGTRRRTGDDAAVARDLLSCAKDRAELAMIVDLVRNDLGRIAEPGSVNVAEPARIMTLPYALHAVASISARRRASASIVDVLRAAFPAGSITGAPKLRAMQIISEREATPRGAYCGIFGRINDRNSDLAVAIRTLVVRGDHVRLHAGGGIVADSDPASEWDEVRIKASAMAAALGGSV